MSSERPLQRLRSLLRREQTASNQAVSHSGFKTGEKSESAVEDPHDLSDSAARNMGIALYNCSIYGSSHPAAREAVENAANICGELVAKYRKPVEILLLDEKISINGRQVREADQQLLAQHLNRHACSGFILRKPFKQEEFFSLIGLLCQAAPAKGESNQLKTAFSGWRSIRPVQIERGGGPGISGHGAGFGVREDLVDSSAGAHILDIGAEMTLEQLVQTLEADNAESRPSAEPVQNFDYLMRQLYSLAENPEEETLDKATKLIQEISRQITTTESEIRTRMGGLVAGIHSDREAVEQMEMEARARGVTLRVSRQDFLEKLAELIQELHQPLTVAAGVLELLLSGRMDSLTINQSEMLELAADSMTRVTNLAEHLKNIVGNPTSLTPDGAVINAAFADPAVQTERHRVL